MSYSFNIRAANKSEAGSAVEAELGKVVASQPIHETDRHLEQDTAEKMLDLLRDDDTQDVAVWVSGSCSSWNTPDGLNQISLNVSAQTVARTNPES